jgi:methylated-DNA-[protein]-cysteine S-methyltransferase
VNALTTWTTTIDSPVGPLLLTSDGTSLTRLLFAADPDPSWSTDPCPVLDEAVRQLGEYFVGERRDFDLPLDPVGTPFQLTVWAALRDIPYAETINYGQLAGRVGNPNSSRAVGLANGRNPISIVRRAGPQADAARAGAAYRRRPGATAQPALTSAVIA